MEDAELARLARQMDVPLEDADMMYAQAIADAPRDRARALSRYVELLQEFRGAPRAHGGRRPSWPGKRALTSRLSAPGAQNSLHARPNSARADRSPGWPGQHALTSRLAAPAAAQYAMRSAEPTASPDDQVDAPLDQALRYSRGAPLATELRRLLEGMFWQRFDDVQIHLDNSASTAAASINARAFTIANHMFFREDAYRPDTLRGLELIAHELAHVIQWRQGRIPQVSGASRISHPGDALEQEAAATAHDVTRAAATTTPDVAYAAASATTHDASGAAAVATAHDTPGAAATAECDATGAAAMVATHAATRSATPAATHPRDVRFPVGAPAAAYTSVATAGVVLREGSGDPHASVDVIPTGGTSINKVGIVAWDASPPLRLRSSPNTAADNVISQLAFKTHLQVIKEFPGKWYFVSTQDGQLGYVAKDYVKTNLPEPNATLHRVEAGLPGFAISIAEKYYKQYANDWGQDLRFYVNVLAWVNKRTVPNTTDGWRDVKFDAGDLIWIPSHDFARSLRGVVNSGSITHNIADKIGIADFLDRTGELWDDFRTAVALSAKYIPEAIGRHVEAAILGVLQSIAEMLAIAAAILAISTALGAAIGALAGGVGAAPGAAAGFEVGMVLLNWLGLGMLVVWIGQALVKVGSAFGSFLGAVWNARGDEKKLDLAAHQFAEALGTLCGVSLEALVMYAVSIGATKALGGLRGSRFGKAFNNAKAGEWLNERVRRVKSGEAPLATPKDVHAIGKQAAAEKLAAQKRTAAERAAAEKSDAGKAGTGKPAADKAAAEKTEADKAAAEKAAADKAAAKKEAADKAAAEKTEADKAAAEKAAADKAAAEKAAADKAAAEKEAAKQQLPPGYDPATRTMQQLTTDRRPSPRPGETPVQAQARARAAEAEILRRAPEIFDALGDVPRRVNPRIEDAAHAPDGAHTTGPNGRHGADIPLRRANNPGGKTIEGRVLGDPPWPQPERASMRWKSDSVMVRVINDYIRANWQQVRTDLALYGEHNGGGDAGAAIGEGFVNTGTAAAPMSEFAVSSLFKVRIKLIEGPRVDFFVLTGFPAPMGL